MVSCFVLAPDPFKFDLFDNISKSNAFDTVLT